MSLLRHRLARTFILFTMIVLAIFYAGARLWDLRIGSLVYGGIVPGSPRADIRYAMGPPPRVAYDGGNPQKTEGDAATASDWIYDQGGSRTRLHFSKGADSLEKVSCTDPEGTAFSCPETLGITTGTIEDDIWYRLGEPTTQRYVGDIKLLEYRELGLEFALRRVRVVRISLSRRDRRFGYVMRLPTALIP